MKKSNQSTNGCNRILSPLTPAESGLSFTVAVFTVLVISLVFSLAVTAIASGSGLTTEQFNEAIKDNLVYNALAYGLSSVSLFLSVVILCRLKGRKPLADVPLKKPRARFWAIALLLVVGLLFGFTELNNLFISALQKIGYSKPDMSIPNDRGYELAMWLILAAAFPAFFEECIFRGYLLEGLKELGTVFAVIVGGLLFSLFHQNPQQTPYQFICGMAFTLLAVKCNSLLPCMAMHFLNNAVILVTDFFSVPAFSPTVSIILTVLGLACFIAGIVWLILTKTEKSAPTEQENPANHTKSRFLLFAMPGMVACLIMWVADLISYLGV
ncbi:MAG: CPBP family intramembrane metalloprotease [Clostridia bacterium]|nr:CPBP family intramembrane metalloprotease [Clostridia bacterium]